MDVGAMASSTTAVLQAVADPAVVAVAAKKGLALILENKLAALGVAFLMSPLAVNMAARLLNKIPLNPWFLVVETVFDKVSLVGTMKFHAPLWDPVEQFIVRLLKGTVDAAVRGILKDNAAPPPAPPQVP